MLILGLDDACSSPTGPAPFRNVSGDWNYVTDTMVDSVAQLRCVVTTPMTLAQQSDGTITGTYRGMSVTCQSPSGPVVVHRDGAITGLASYACLGSCPSPPPQPEWAAIEFDSTFRNFADVSDGTHLSGSVSSPLSINGKPFAGVGKWTATKR